MKLIVLCTLLAVAHGKGYPKSSSVSKSYKAPADLKSVELIKDIQSKAKVGSKGDRLSKLTLGPRNDVFRNQYFDGPYNRYNGPYDQYYDGPYNQHYSGRYNRLYDGRYNQNYNGLYNQYFDGPYNRYLGGPYDDGFYNQYFDGRYNPLLGMQYGINGPFNLGFSNGPFNFRLNLPFNYGSSAGINRDFNVYNKRYNFY